MKATVFVEGEGEEPTTVEHDLNTGLADVDFEGENPGLTELLDLIGLHVADVFITSEYSLKLAVWALQRINANSRCHQSRVTAKMAMMAIVEAGDIEDNGDGMPVPIPFPGRAEDMPDGPWTVGA
jgi:hypothetical protein